MGDDSKPGAAGDENQPPVEMANDEGADPSGDIERQNSGGNSADGTAARGNIFSEKDGDAGLDAPQAHPS
ncbi:hypothetical protein [Sphingomonas crusticola]|uniref:hypothetical protein n=1 Tax=Sphingomonas crusticola TaxID=1697973 RepID=UPI000E259005|nr:hypothetical protein [Sphingomonas crusticola]